MKNIDTLLKQTKQKRLGQYNGESHAAQEEKDFRYARDIHRQQEMAYNQKLGPSERPQDFQKNYFKEEYTSSQTAGQRRVEEQKRAVPARAVQNSMVDPKLYEHPNADKEVLNLVESQFGKGFLELNFDDDDQDTRTQSKKPLSNPASKKTDAFEFDYSGPKSVKNPKTKPAPQFEFEQYESQYVTAGNKKKAIFDDEEHPSREQYSKPQSKKQKPLFQNEEDEDNGYNGFENFQDFNKFASQEDYGQKGNSQSHVSPQNSKKEQPVTNSSLQMSGFNDDFLNFDLLGEGGDAKNSQPKSKKGGFFD